MEQSGIDTRMTDKSLNQNELIELLNHAISLLSSDHEKAVELLHPYIPVNGPVTIDYGIYSLQYALIFGEDIQKNYKSKNKTLPLIIRDLFEDCKTKNLKEYQKLLDWIKKEMPQVTEQIKRARVNLRIDSALQNSLGALSPFNPQAVHKLILSLHVDNPTHHLVGNAYKDLYEISFFLELLANLILISGGANFPQNPFDGLQINGRSLLDRAGRLVKGNAINWLESNSDISLKGIIQSCYDNKLRNLLGGHNDYVFDSSTQTYTSKDGKITYEYTKVFSYLSALELLIAGLRLDGLTRCFEDAEEPVELYDIGFTNWSFNKNRDELLITQNWSNFNLRDKTKPPTSISFYRLPVKREGKYICLGFNNNYIFPYDLRVRANESSLELMKSLFEKDTIKIVIVGVAPAVSPFTYMSKAKITLHSKEFLVTNELRTEVKIDKPGLKTLIEYLKS